MASQTYRGAMECLIVDDCGTDDSIAIAERFISEYTGEIQFRIVHHDRNRGLSAARNTGTNHASGEYLYYLDSDDWLTEDCIERMMECVEKHPGVELVIGSAYDVFPDVTLAPGWYNPDSKTVPEYTEDRKEIRRLNLSFCDLPVTAWNKLVKRTAVLERSIFFEEGLLNEDVLFDCLLGKHIQTMAVCFTPTYFYLRREGSLSSDSMKKRSDESFLKMAEIQLSIIDDDIRQELSCVVLKIAFKRYIFGVTEEIRKNSERLLLKLLPECDWKTKIGILLSLSLPVSLLRKHKVYSGLFLFKFFRIGHIYNI